jgi:hypothetical protein
MAKSKRPARKKSATKKAASKKSAPKKAARKSATSRSRGTTSRAARAADIPIVAATQPASVAATVNITFTAGVGQATASLFRKGVLINMQSISQSANILFSDVQSRDGLAIAGVSAGTTTITISVPTSPKTPDQRPVGPFHRSYIIL